MSERRRKPRHDMGEDVGSLGVTRAFHLSDAAADFAGANRL